MLPIISPSYTAFSIFYQQGMVSFDEYNQKPYRSPNATTYQKSDSRIT